MQTIFAVELNKAVMARRVRWSDVAQLMKQHDYEVSDRFVGQIGRGEKKPPVPFINAACKALRLDENRTRRLHRAAAIDAGYIIGAL